MLHSVVRYTISLFSQLNSQNLHSGLRPTVLSFPQPEDTEGPGPDTLGQPPGVDDCGALDITDKGVEV